jgi:hypothetical protein
LGAFGSLGSFCSFAGFSAFGPWGAFAASGGFGASAGVPDSAGGSVGSASGGGGAAILLAAGCFGVAEGFPPVKAGDVAELPWLDDVLPPIAAVPPADCVGVACLVGVTAL